MEMENDLIYKNEKKLREHLQELEKTYNEKSFTSIREEQVLALFKDVRAISEKLCKIHQRIDYSKRSVADLKTSLKDLYSSRKYLIEDYCKKRETYSQWLKNRRKQVASSTPLTFPLGRRNQHIQHLGRCGKFKSIFSSDFEPFYEYKTTCQRLIAYLESLQLQVEDTENSTQRENISFAENGRHIEEDDGMISHQLEYVRLFAEIDLDLPVTYQQVPKALEDVRARLEACKEQTKLVAVKSSRLNTLGNNLVFVFHGLYHKVFQIHQNKICCCLVTFSFQNFFLAL
ncbi:unnamed protein product [Enterobius vermicularis]|uniref:Translin-associated factor X-interacting protein 1 n=1 Tax=Enterobius vermicularis TaxID=51028 RepID=A0A0N4VME0_ENTVE|nr:unnamed protein product [Enterobius vermicularis]